MKYALLICDDERVSPSNEELEADPVHRAWRADLDRRGRMEFGVRLRPAVDATTVRVRDGETLVSDGPFAETKDFVGGVVRLRDREKGHTREGDAIAAARRWLPMVEVDPAIELIGPGAWSR